MRDQGDSEQKGIVMDEQVEGTDVDQLEVEPDEVVTTRRRLFQMGLAGAAAVAGAAAIDAIESSPAGAATGGNMIIGGFNTVSAQTDITSLFGGPLAVDNNSSSDTAITAVNFGGNAIQGVATGGSTGVEGDSVTGIGVLGKSTDTTSGTGVHGASSGTSGVGVSGSAPSASTQISFGIQGTGTVGVQGASNGVDTPTSIGVQGIASGVGPALHGVNTTGPSLNLTPIGSSTLPTVAHPGDFIVLSNGSVHYSYAANNWVQLNNGIVTLPAPVRIIDTVHSVGGITGPLSPGTTVHTTSVLTGAHGIPAQALGLIGNFAISGVSGALLNGLGVATIYPAGVPTPVTANINAGAGCFAISNTVTVAFGAGSNAGKLSIVWGGGGAVPKAQAFFDVTGYIL